MIVTAKISSRSTQSKKYYERSFGFEEVVFDKDKKECFVNLPGNEHSRLENFFKEYFCEEYYIEIPSGNLYFTTKTQAESKNGSVQFNIYKEEKIAYPEKEKV